MDLAIANDDLATARRLLAVVDEDAQRLRIPPAVRGHRHRFAGLLGRESDPEAVEGLLRSALGAFSAWGSPHYRARAAGELGAWLVLSGRNDEGAQLLEEARTALSELGAWAWLSGIEDQQVARS
jgi:hypothetical protein